MCSLERLSHLNGSMAADWVIPPSIDPFSAKNEAMSRRNAELALVYVGVLEGEGAPPVVPFARRDGSPGRINRRVDLVQNGPRFRSTPLWSCRHRGGTG